MTQASPKHTVSTQAEQFPAAVRGPRRQSRLGDYWGTAASILVHGAIIGALMWSPDAPPPSLAAAIETTMMMPALEVAEAVETPDVVTTTVKPQGIVEEGPIETLELAEATPDIVEEIRPEELAPTVQPEAQPDVEVIETRAVEPPVVIPPAPRPRPVRKAPAPAPEALPAPPSPAPVATHVAKAASSVTVGPPPDYLTKLRAWLEKYKEYPRQAQRRRQEGTALLRFTFSRDGRLLAHSIERSSGFRSLDDAAEKMIERAAPLPPLPPEMSQASLEIVVPVAFLLR